MFLPPPRCRIAGAGASNSGSTICWCRSREYFVSGCVMKLCKPPIGVRSNKSSESRMAKMERGRPEMDKLQVGDERVTNYRPPFYQPDC
jgi:hypothetical protein